MNCACPPGAFERQSRPAPARQRRDSALDRDDHGNTEIENRGGQQTSDNAGRCHVQDVGFNVNRGDDGEPVRRRRANASCAKSVEAACRGPAQTRRLQIGRTRAPRTAPEVCRVRRNGYRAEGRRCAGTMTVAAGPVTRARQARGRDCTDRRRPIRLQTRTSLRRKTRPSSSPTEPNT